MRTIFCFKEMSVRELLTRRSTDADGTTEWKWGPLLQAAIRGDLAVLDGIHRLPRGLLAAAVGRLVADRTLDLPDGRLVSPEHYHALLGAGRSEEELRAANIRPVHPAFRVICTSEPPEKMGQMDWLSDELLALFLFVGVSPLDDSDHMLLFEGSLPEKTIEGVMGLTDSIRKAARKEPAIYRPLQLSTRRLLQISRYAKGGDTTQQAEALHRVLRPPFALLPETAQGNVLAMISDASAVLPQLLAGGHTRSAGRLVGAFRNIGRERIADDILKSMRAADHEVREIDPFAEKLPFNIATRETSPYVNRVRLMWQMMHESIQASELEMTAQKIKVSDYLKNVDDIYVTDAYHSLSIEGYQVTLELINKVKEGNWRPDTDAADRELHNALAARGYWEAFQLVKESVAKVLQGEEPGDVVDHSHADWYRSLFAPSVVAGIIKPADLAGYRNRPVYIKQSRHVPPNYEVVRELMPEFFDLLKDEMSAESRIILGHFIFVFIHPYVDGNGRIARFLMNVMRAAAGYPWLVIPVEERDHYMKALEEASVKQNILPFTKFIARLSGMK